MVKRESYIFFVAVSVLVGTCIGAGVLGIPYVAANSGFWVAIGYILALGLIILFVNLYLGEIALRTKGNHQIIGYAKKYLGKGWKNIVEFAMIFGLFAALSAYMLGVGESISYLIRGDTTYALWAGISFGLIMAFLIKGGVKSLKKFEKIGVIIILSLLVAILGFFIGDVSFSNLSGFYPKNLFLPFGVVLFALMSFYSVPEVRLVLKNKERYFKKAVMTGTFISVLFYILFAFIVVGFKGVNTPEVATLALGPVFIFLGILTMFTSYLSSGNALIEDFVFDERFGKNLSWFLASILPIGVFVFVEFTDFFSFTNILSIGGVVSGGILAISVLFMVKSAKKKGDRKPEYSIPANWFIIGFLSLIFLLGVVRELFSVFR